MIDILLVIIRISAYLMLSIEAIRRRNYIVNVAMISFITANTVDGFGITGGLLSVFRTLGAVVLYIGYRYYETRTFRIKT